MLEVRAVAAIERHGGPFIAQYLGFRSTRIPHRLDRQYHAFGQFYALALLAEIRDLRRFVQLLPNSVSHKLAHHAETVCLDVLLDRRPDVPDRVADPRLLNSFVQRSFRNLEQL